MARAQEQVVGIAEKNFDIQVLKLGRSHGLNGRLSSNRHENRSLDDSVRQVKSSAASPCGGVSIKKLEFHSARWHAARRSSGSRRRGGSSILQRSTAIGHLV